MRSPAFRRPCRPRAGRLLLLYYVMFTSSLPQVSSTCRRHIFPTLLGFQSHLFFSVLIFREELYKISRLFCLSVLGVTRSSLSVCLVLCALQTYYFLSMSLYYFIHLCCDSVLGFYSLFITSHMSHYLPYF